MAGNVDDVEHEDGKGMAGNGEMVENEEMAKGWQRDGREGRENAEMAKRW